MTKQQTPSELVERAQLTSRIFNNEYPDWWNLLTDHQRRILKASSSSMAEAAFKAGVAAALQSPRTIASGERVERLRDIFLMTQGEDQSGAVVGWGLPGIRKLTEDVIRFTIAALEAVDSDVERLRACVELAERTFRRYEEIHRQKGTPDGDAKAENNRELADTMLAALS